MVLLLTGLLNRRVIDLSIGVPVLFKGLAKLRPNDPILILSILTLPMGGVSSWHAIMIVEKRITQRITNKNKGTRGCRNPLFQINPKQLLALALKYN
jgi:hypothetical protein